MKITIFADVHYFGADIKEATFDHIEKPVRYALPLLDWLMENTESDLAINLGDLIQDTINRDRDLMAIKFMFEKLKGFKCPCYSVLGNHELKMMNSTEEVEEFLGYKGTYSVNKDGWHLVFLTPETRPELGLGMGGSYKAQYLSDKTLAWLEEDLSKNSLPTMIFTHYAIAEDPSVKGEYNFMKNRDRLKKILSSHSEVKAVFSGHQHRARSISEGGIDYYVIPSLISDLDFGASPSRDYAKINTDGEKIEVSFLKITEDEVGEIPPEEV